MKKLLGVVCSLVFPPLGVLVAGGTGGEVVFNLILTLLFWVPGLIHALYLVLTRE